MNSNNNFKKYFSSLKYLLTVITVTGILFSCPSGDDAPPNIGAESSLTIESVTYVHGTETGPITNRVPIAASLILTFNRSLSGVNNDEIASWNSITLTSGTSGNLFVSFNFEKVDNDKQIKLNPINNLQPNTTYTLTISSGIKVGNYQLTESQSYSFITAESPITTLKVTYTNASGIHSVYPNDDNIFTLQFSNTNERNAGVYVTLTAPEGASLSNDGRVLTLTSGNTFTTNLTFASNDASYSFTVIAQDGVTTDEYTIKSIIVSSSSRQILSFTLLADDNDGLDNDVSASINEETKAITLSINNIANTVFIPTIDFSGSNVSPASKVATNFSGPVTYTVTARNGDTAIYTVTLKRYHDVTFNAGLGLFTNTGQHVMVTNVAHADKVTVPINLTRDHYALEGWYTAETGGSLFDFDTLIGKPTTLHARWTNKQYKVEFYIDGASNRSTNLPSLSVIPEDVYPTPNPNSIYIWFTDSGYSSKYNTDSTLTNDLVLWTSSDNAVKKDIKLIIDAGVIPDSLDGYDELSRVVFSNYTSGVTVTARYVTTEGTGNGTSWTSATNDLQGAINSISDASDNNIYVVLVSSGPYKPTNSYSMKNHVAIIGGFAANTYERGGETLLDGNGKRGLFSHNYFNYKRGDDLTNSAILYGVTITNGKASTGGGMLNNESSPTLIEVTFSGNTSGLYGGGMYNLKSSPTLINVTFSGNTATREGGGMYNRASFPTLIGVTFSSNTAIDEVNASGGGMYNADSSPTLIGVTFSSNRSGNTGGGMYNSQSFPILIGVTFSGNTANYGGGMINYLASPTLINVTFSGNTSIVGEWIIDNSGVLINTLMWGNSGGIDGGGSSIYYSLIQGATPNTATGVITDGPGQLTFGDHGGGLETYSISATSPAKDAGAYVRGVKTGNSYAASNIYYSSDGNNWYRASNGTPATLPDTTDNLTSKDARGYGLSGRPDIGAFEVQ